MAILGDTSVTKLTSLNEIKTNKLHVPTASNGTTLGAGSNGQVLKTNGTSVYWGADNNTTYSAGAGLTLSGTQFKHSNSVTAATAQGDANKTLTFGGTFTIPTITYDAQGHITGKGTTTMTMPANPNTDTHWTTGITAGETGTTSNSATTNGNTFIKIKDNSTHRGQIKLVGSGATSVSSNAEGVITISSTDNNTTYGVATPSALGLVKSGTDITVDSSGNVSVNDDSHNHVISNIDGLQSALDAKAASNHSHNYLPLSGGTVTGATQFNNYLKLNAWPGYGTGTANFWYDANNKFVEIQNATDLKLAGTKVSKEGHTHNYAGSASAGGSANSAVKLDTATAGDSNTPVYFSGGKPVACTSLDLNTSGNAASASKVNNKLTVGSKSYDGSAAVTIEARDLGLASAMLFLGTTTTAITDGATTNPVAIGGSNKTVIAGNVVLYGSKEFVWTGSAWEELGNEGSYKIVQAAVADPSASGTSNTFIATISQDTNGKITATKKTVAVTNSAPTLAWNTTSTIGTIAGTNLQVKMPANPNTDTKVTQTAINAADYTNWRPLVWGASNNSTEGFTPSTVTDGVYTAQTLSCQPSSGTIRATIFKGNLSGNATTATTATNLASAGTWTWTSGTTAGPTASLILGGKTTSIEAIPSASTSASGIITTGTQTLAGKKTFNDEIFAKGYYMSDCQATPTQSNRFGYYQWGDQVQYTYRDSSNTYIGQAFAIYVTDGHSLWNKDAYHDANILANQNNKFNIGSSTSTFANIYATTFHGALDGNAATATKLATARTIQTNLASTNSASFDGSANITPGVTGILGIGNGGTGANNRKTAITNLGVFGLYDRNDIGTSPNFDNPGVNGFFELRHSSETPGETGIKPYNGFGPFISIRYTNTMFQLSGTNDSGFYIRGKQAANVTLSGVAWKRIWCQGDAVTGAVWNDYAEYREANTIQGGRCVREVGDDTLTLTTKRLMRGCSITSDTWGFAQGETDKAKTPIAVAGRVLAYPLEDRELFKEYIGYSVCSGPDGTVSLMTEEEELKYPWAIVGTISAVPDYEGWGGGEMADRPSVKVDGRIWIKVK